jgi:predicted ATPase
MIWELAMLTRIEIDGFKSFENFGLDLLPFTAIVGPNESGKSNLFDALRFLSLLAQFDIRTAMIGIRGEPEELFRQTSTGLAEKMSFALEMLIGRTNIDAFGQKYETPVRRLRYEVSLGLGRDKEGVAKGVFLLQEKCVPIAKVDERAKYLRGKRGLYNSRVNPFIRLSDDRSAIEVRQDGPTKHGKPSKFPLKEASRTTLSTISSSEYPHLYAIKEVLTQTRFLEINPRAARLANDRFEERSLRPDASNLAATLAHLKDETGTKDRPNGVLSEITADLATMIPSVRGLEVGAIPESRQYSFSLKLSDELQFSSRVISDGTLRLLALLTLLNDPNRGGTLCFEEPENGVHEGRVPKLVEILRESATIGAHEDDRSFQILVNTHSPKFMSCLNKEEIVAADTVIIINPASKTKSSRTRMRAGGAEPSLFPTSDRLSQFEIDKLLQSQVDAA